MKQTFLVSCLVVSIIVNCNQATSHALQKKDSTPTKVAPVDKDPSAKNRDNSPKNSKKREPPEEIRRLIDQARSVPAEFAADSLIRIAQSDKISDRQLKRELLEEAFRSAPYSQQPVRKRYLHYFHVDTRTGNLGRAFALQLDSLSLQCKAVRAMIQFGKQRARELFSEIPKPHPPALTCADTLVSDVSDFYDTLKNLVQDSFTSTEMHYGMHVRFAEPYIGDLTSPLQVAQMAKMVLALKLQPDQQDSLIDIFSNRLKNIAGDDRSFTLAVRSNADVQEVMKLAEACNKQSSSPIKLVKALQSYLISHLHNTRCADNVALEVNSGGLPAFVKLFNDKLNSQPYLDGVSPISAEDIKASKIEGAGNFYPYWETPEAKMLLERIQNLRFGSKKVPLTIEERASTEWQSAAATYLGDLARWGAESESSAADHFHQKSVLMVSLIELLPAGSLRNDALGRFLAFLTRNSFQEESRIEWFDHARYLLRTLLSTTKEEGRAASLAALRDSEDPVLSLYVALEQADLEAKK